MLFCIQFNCIVNFFLNRSNKLIMYSTINVNQYVLFLYISGLKFKMRNCYIVFI